MTVRVSREREERPVRDGKQGGRHAALASSHTALASKRAALGSRIEALPRRAYLTWCLVLLALALALRWGLAVSLYLRPNSDQVMVGLMARHILLGERPLFYWGQAYNGTLESYITAIVFRLFGASYAALHVAPVLFSLLFVGAMLSLTQQLYGRAAALATGAALVPAPALLMEFSLWPGYNYLEAMAFGTLALACALPIAQGKRWWRLPVACFLLGLALWAQPLAVVYLPTLAVLVLGPAVQAMAEARQRRALLGAAVGSVIALLAGLWPAISYNLQTHWSTISFLSDRPSSLHLSLLEEFRRTVFWAGPVFTGLIPPTEDPHAFQQFIHRDALLYALALVLLGMGGLLLLRQRRTVMRWLQSLLTARPMGQGALLVLSAILLCAYVFSTWSSSRWSATEPRYLLPLFTLTPLLVRAIFPPHASRQRLYAGGAVALLIVGGGMAGMRGAPNPADVRPLAAYLEANHVDAVYGDYWIVYRLAFVSDDRLVPVVTKPDLTLGLNRYQPYLQEGLHRPHPAWVVPAHSATERLLRTCLAHRQQPYREATVSGSDGPWSVLTGMAPGLISCTD